MKPFVFRWLLPLGVAIVLAIVLWLFVSSHIYTISGNAMYPFAVDGDLVYTEKTENIKSGDILLISNPLDYKSEKPRLSYSRCVASPGDKVQIYGKRLYVNDKLQQQYHCSFDVEILLLTDSEKQAAKTRYQLVDDSTQLFNTNYIVTENQYNRIKEESILSHIQKSVLPDYLYDSKLFPFARQYHYNKDFYGPIVVPSKGMKIKLNAANYLFYKYLFFHSEKTKVEYKDGSFYVDGVKSDSYTFKNDYYFLLNDYLDDPSDSRTFGPVSFNDIERRVTSVFFHF